MGLCGSYSNSDWYGSVLTIISLETMKIFVLKESNSDARVSASPETTKKLVELGLDVNVQAMLAQNQIFLMTLILKMVQRFLIIYLKSVPLI